MLIWFYIFLVPWSIASGFLLYVLIRPLVRGAVYYPTTSEGIEAMVRLTNPQPGERVADLGSGDGRIIIAFARQGCQAHGYEINPLLVWKSRQNIKRAGLQGRAVVHWSSFWREDLSRFNIVSVYGFPHIMRALERKLKRELRPASRVASNVYRFPAWLPNKEENQVYLYTP